MQCKNFSIVKVWPITICCLENKERWRKRRVRFFDLFAFRTKQNKNRSIELNKPKIKETEPNHGSSDSVLLIERIMSKLNIFLSWLGRTIYCPIWLSLSWHMNVKFPVGEGNSSFIIIIIIIIIIIVVVVFKNLLK
jgi:hypothetical protein